MSIEIKVPTLGESVSEATIAKWLKNVGDAVKADEALVELETDKVTVEVNAPSAGVLASIVAETGSTVEVGALLGTLSADGKGVAAALGVLLAGNWLLGLATVATFAIVLYFSRYVSLASMVAAVFAPVYFLFGAGSAWDMDGTTVLALAVMSALLIWRHAENINRLLKGTESRLGQKKH